MAIMDYSLVQRIIDGLGKILDTKPGSPDEGTYVTEQQLADWIKGQTVVPAYYYNGVMYSDALHTTPITGQAGALYIDQDNNVLYRWDGAAWDAMSDNQLRQDILDGTVVAKKAECDEDGNNIKATYATKAEVQAADTNLNNALQATNARVENLEEKAGGYSVVNYRGTNAVPTGKAKYALVESIVGKSRAWNQLCKNGNFASNSDWSSLSCTVVISNNKAVVTMAENSATNKGLSQDNVLLNGHYFLIKATIKNSYTDTLEFRFGQPYSNVSHKISDTINANSTKTIIGILSADAPVDGTENVLQIKSILNNVANVFEVSDVLVRDLTLIFPEGVPSTVAECVARCPSILEYDAYGYSLVDTVVDGVRSKGSNRMSLNGLEAVTSANVTFTPTFNSDGELEYLTATGTSNASGNFDILRYDDFHLPIGTYFIGFGANSVFNDIMVNVNGAWATLNRNGGTITVTDPSQAIWIRGRFASGVAFGGAKLYPKINIGSTELEFSPYMTDTLSLPSPVTLRSAGSVAEVYDLESGEKTNPLGRITFTEDSAWDLRIDTGTRVDFRIAVDNLASYTDENQVPNQMIDGFVTVKENGTVVPYNCFRLKAVVGQIYASMPTGTTLEQIKAYMAGRTLTYELATPNAPTQLDPIQNNMLQTEGGGTINTIQTQTPVIDNSMDVGYLAL